MTISKKQWAAMAVIVVAGLAAAGGLLLASRPSAVGVAQAEAGEHAEPGHQQEGHGPEEKGHDEKGHGEKGHDEKPSTGQPSDTVPITPEQARAAGIAVAVAGPAEVRHSVQFPGEVRLDDDRTAHVVPRLAGVVQQVAVQLGQQVRRGQVLAVIASTALAEQRSELLTAQKRRDLARATHAREQTLWREKISAEQDFLQAQAALQEAEIAVQSASQKLAAVGASGQGAGGLNRFEIRAPFDGTILEKHLALGEAVKEDASIFTLSDLGSVWAEFAVAPQDLATVRVGQQVVVSSTAFESQAAGTLSYVGALLGEQTRTAKARVTLRNPGAAWRPGLFVTVSVLGDPQPAAVAVSAQALQTVEGQTRVFVAVPGGYAARAVKTGRSDGQRVEITQGLAPGEQVVVANSFVLKSELGKDSAGHGH